MRSLSESFEKSPLLDGGAGRIEGREASRLELLFWHDGEHTRMSIPAQQPPWRAIRAFHNPERQAVAHLHNVSGGVLAGDSLSLMVEAGPNTRVQLTTVGATRIYRHRAGSATARSATWIRVGDGAMVEYLPDPVIPFARSRFSQSTMVSLGADAGFIGWETIASGRVASGEVFEFDAFESDYGIYSHARPLVLERYSLRPSVRNPRSVARWGRFRYTAALYVCHTGVGRNRWRELESRLNELAFARSSTEVRWGASSLVAGGLVVRGMALEAHRITAGLLRFWEIAKEEIGHERAIPPRKIN